LIKTLEKDKIVVPASGGSERGANVWGVLALQEKGTLAVSRGKKWEKASKKEIHSPRLGLKKKDQQPTWLLREIV